MKVLVVYNVVEELGKGQVHDILAERGVLEAAAAITEGLCSRGYDAVALPVKDDLAAVLAPYDPRECVVFNLVESLDNGQVPETHATAFMEGAGFVFTGSGTETLGHAMHKLRAKEILARHGLPTPRAQLFDAPDLRFALTFPAIVKPVAEDASLGVSADAVVSSLAELRLRVAYVLQTYRQPALVEEFIDGREINAAVWGNDPPEVLPLSELDFSRVEDPRHRICSYEAKWIEGSYGWENIHAVCPAPVEPGIKSQLERIALASYAALGCRDYAWVDMRLRGDEIYVLEVNPNPDLSPGVGFIRSATVAGYDYAGIVARIVEFAVARWNVRTLDVQRSNVPTC